MQWVPVISSTGNKLMPCHAARARQLVNSGKAVRRFDRGLFYIKLSDRKTGDVQPISVGIDTGSKKEAITVKSLSHTYLNIQADAITWVSKHEEISTMMRKNRRWRNTPYRKHRPNRSRGKSFLPPSTRARWGLKIRLCNWLNRYFPINIFVVEDIKATSRPGKGGKWNKLFSPLERGKNWFYSELKKLSQVETKRGYETKKMRDSLGLKKSGDKLSESFYAHCVDSWVLANSSFDGKEMPDNQKIIYITPLQFHRRQLHRLQPSMGGRRCRYGGTISLGFKRGSWINHSKYGMAYVGGVPREGRISLFNIGSGKQISNRIKPEDCKFITYSSWRIRYA
jgi:hypothetical protein